MKTGKAPVHSDISLQLIAASKEAGIDAMAVLCQSSTWIGNAS